MANGESRNGKAELATITRIIERDRTRLHTQRVMLAQAEKAIADTLERINLAKRRQLELEVIILRRKK